jgi:Tfp pilus assembly protein FimT
MTFIELIIVVAIIIIIAAGSSPFYVNLIAKNNLNSVSNGFVSTLRKAQTYAISGKNNTTWGVCVTGNNIRLFGGSCALPTLKEEITIPSGTTVSSYSTVTFTATRGEPSSAFTFTVNNQSGTKTIIINSAGNVSAN